MDIGRFTDNLSSNEKLLNEVELDSLNCNFTKEELKKVDELLEKVDKMSCSKSQVALLLKKISDILVLSKKDSFKMNTKEKLPCLSKVLVGSPLFYKYINDYLIATNDLEGIFSVVDFKDYDEVKRRVSRDACKIIIRDMLNNNKIHDSEKLELLKEDCKNITSLNDLYYLNNIIREGYKNSFKAQYRICKYYNLFLKDVKNEIIKKIEDKEIDFSSINYKEKIDYDRIPFVNNETIVAIDDATSQDLDGAFSIKRFGDNYFYNVYIADVPYILSKDRKLAQLIYQRANSKYIRANGSNISIDMLPTRLASNTLSLKKGNVKGVIHFKYTFFKDGTLFLNEVKRKKIRVDYNITPKEALQILSSNSDSPLKDNLLEAKKLCNIIKTSSQNDFLSSMNPEKLNSLIAFPSLLVNYTIGRDACFSIYRENGMYTKKSNSFYTHSATPIRRFVSDINLAFYLHEHNAYSFNEKDLSYIVDNIDDVVNHLNEQEKIRKFVGKESYLIKKYVLK